MNATTQSQPTDRQLAAVRLVSAAILEAICASGDAGIPSGHLYSMLMNRMSLDTYNQFIDALVRHRKITNQNYLLKAAV